MAGGKRPLRALALLLWLAPFAPAADEPRAPAPIRFELDRKAVRAGDTLTITVVLQEEQREPAGAEPALSCDFCKVGPVERVGPRTYRARLTAPRTIPATRSILLFARSDPGSAELEIPVVPGPPATLEVSGPRTLVADGSTAELRVTLADAHGNPAEIEPLARAGRGTLGAPQQVGRGIWVLSYRPRASLERAEDEIVVQAGAATGSWRIRLDTRGAWLGLSAWAGAAVSGGSPSLALGVGLSRWWRDQRDELALALEAGWWRLDERTTVALPGGDAELASERSYLPLTISLSWGHLFGRRAAVLVAAGGGAARVSSSQQIAGQARVTEARWTPAASASLTVGARTLRGFPFLELRALWTGDPGLATVEGTSRALLVLGGYRYDAR